MGLVNTILELLLLFLTFVFTLKYYMSPERDPMYLMIGLALGAALILGKLIAIYLTGQFIKEYIPVEKRFNRIPQPKPVSRTGIKEPGFKADFEDERITFS